MRDKSKREMGRIVAIFTLLIAFGAEIALAEQARFDQEKNRVIQTLVDDFDLPIDSVFYYYTEGVRIVNIFNDTNGASEQFSRALRIDSMHAPSLYEMAAINMMTDPKKALEYSTKALQVAPSDYWYLTQSAHINMMLSNYYDAQKSYEKMMEIDPQDPDNYRMLALLLTEQKQFVSAITVLDRAEKVVGKLEFLSQHKRELLIGMGLYDRAIDENKSLIANYPYEAKNYLSIAELYAHKGEDSLAMANYSAALELEPDGIEALISLSQYHGEKDNHEEFLKVVKRIFLHKDIAKESKFKQFRNITANTDYYRENYYQILDLASTLYGLYPNDFEAMNIYAGSMMGAANIEGARALYKEFAAKPREDKKVNSYLNVISLEAYLEQYDSVKKYITIADREFPRSYNLHITSGWVVLGMQSVNNRNKLGLSHFKKAYQYADTDSLKSVVLGTIGDMYHQEGDEKRAYKYYTKALTQWEDNIHTLNNYAYYLSVEGRELEKALKMSKRTIELEPKNPTYMDTYAWILYKLERYDQAKKIMQQALALDTTKSKELMMHYGDILYELGEYYMATIYWRRAKDAGASQEEVDARMSLPNVK